MGQVRMHSALVLLSWLILIGTFIMFIPGVCACNSNEDQIDSGQIGDIRLVGGRNASEGHLEVRCMNQTWESLCDYNWETDDNTIACHMSGTRSFNCSEDSGFQLHLNEYVAFASGLFACLVVVIIVVLVIRRIRSKQRYPMNSIIADPPCHGVRPVSLISEGAYEPVTPNRDNMDSVDDDGYLRPVDNEYVDAGGYLKPGVSQAADKNEYLELLNESAEYLELLTNDEYEKIVLSNCDLMWEGIMLSGKKLGKGSMGQVHLGRVFIMGKWIPSAIKTLKDTTMNSENALFRGEFEIMKKIKPHPNVLNVLGLCEHEGALYVALEYAPYGNLKMFLRKSRKVIKGIEDTVKLESDLSSEQLFDMIQGLAKGMMHLATNGVIHRDLAARNVLVGRNCTPKIADFGLSRGGDIYVQVSTQRVPIRWLAIEALAQKTYTTKSDVWSFGILLWEIITFGAFPYSDIKAPTLPDRLKKGYRLPKPGNCDDDIYNLMQRCWQENPDDRPSFRDIVDILSNMKSGEKISTSTNFYDNYKIGTD